MASLGTPISFHRLMKQPLDDSEIYTSADDLMDYCSSGAWYPGQEVSVKYSDGIVMNYKIVDAQPLIKMDRFEPVWITNSSSHYMLIYYCNGTTFNDGSLLTHLDDPYKFALFDTLPIFDKSGDNYTFLLKYRSTTPGSSETTTSGLTSSNPVNGLNSTFNSVTLMPSSSYSYIVKLYVKADNYYNALGVE